MITRADKITKRQIDKYIHTTKENLSHECEHTKLINKGRMQNLTYIYVYMKLH